MTCKEFDICRNTVTSYLIYKKEFLLEDLMNDILKKGGVFRANNYQSLGQYLDKYENEGILTYSPAEGKYINNMYESYKRFFQK